MSTVAGSDSGFPASGNDGEEQAGKGDGVEAADSSVSDMIPPPVGLSFTPPPPPRPSVVLVHNPNSPFHHPNARRPSDATTITTPGSHGSIAAPSPSGMTSLTLDGHSPEPEEVTGAVGDLVERVVSADVGDGTGDFARASSVTVTDHTGRSESRQSHDILRASTHLRQARSAVVYKKPTIGILGGMGFAAGYHFQELFHKALLQIIKELPAEVRESFENEIRTQGVDAYFPDEFALSRVMPRRDWILEERDKASKEMKSDQGADMLYRSKLADLAEDLASDEPNPRDPTFCMKMAITQLAAFGADIIAIPCNTAMIYKPFIEDSCPGSTIIDIVGETVAAIPSTATKVGLMSTKATREGRLYHKACLAKGIEVVTLPDEPLASDPKGRSLQGIAAEIIEAVKELKHVPEEDSIFEAMDYLKLALMKLQGAGKRQASLALKGFAENLLSHDVAEDPRKPLYEDMSTIMEFFKSEGCQSVILGCTEFPVVQQFNYKTHGLNVVNSTEALANAVAREVREQYVRRAEIIAKGNLSHGASL